MPSPSASGRDMTDIIGGIALPLVLALAGWLGFIHKRLMTTASRESLQEHRLNVLETRVNAQSDKLDKILTQLSRLEALLERER